MCIVTILVDNVPESQEVELFLTAASCGIDGEQDGPCDTAANQACGGSNLEISEEQKGIERLVVEDEAIGDFDKYAKPIEHALRQSGRTFPVEEIMSIGRLAAWNGWHCTYCGRRLPRKVRGS